MTAITQAFVLGAGLGTRLRPLTDDLPKPLVPVFQKPLITFALDHLIDTGVNSFVINTHRLPELFRDFFRENNYTGRSVTLVHEPHLLDTGGGMKNIERFLGTRPFVVYSGDILTDADLEPLIEEHFRAKNDVTLGLRRNTGLGAGVVMRDGRISAISRESNPKENFDYANISVWNPEIFHRIPAKRKISFIPILVDWIGAGGKIGGLELDDGKWFNIGSRKEYLDVHRDISTERWKPRYVTTRDWSEPVAKSAQVDATAEIRGCSVVGADCRVEADVILEDTILWPGAQIASRSELHRCIVRTHRKVSGTHRNLDI
ncbi:MAG TPA: sugar phosphate nucleotidyltransferase [Chthoniobacterales bacterium]|nr:sugar phosphate nucleotidyltransferase [Chthoniobacterales bacterium]